MFFLPILVAVATASKLVTGKSFCDDTNWVDKGGDGCSIYTKYEWCENGFSLKPISKFYKYAVNGVSAIDACSDCGDCEIAMVNPDVSSQHLLSTIKNDNFKKTRTHIQTEYSHFELNAVALINTTVYTAGDDMNIYQIELTDPDRVPKSYPSGHNGSIYCLDVTEDLVVTGSSDNTVRIWRRKDMQLLHTIHDHTEELDVCKLKENLLVTGASDKTAIVYTLTAQGQPTMRHVLKGHTSWVYAVDINADYIATASFDNTVKIWNRRTGDLYKTMRHGPRRHSDEVYSGDYDGVYSVRFLDASHVASVGYEKLIIWDVHTGTAIKTLDNGDWGYVEVHGGLIYTTRNNKNEVLVWDFTAGANSMPTYPVKIIKTDHTNQISAIDITASTIVTTSHDGTINVIEFNP